MKISELNAGAIVPEEIDIQRAIVQYLQLRKFTVLTTNVSIRGANEAREKGARVGLVCSPGVPDLLVSHPKWPEGCWLGLEVKRPKIGKLSAAQKVLHDAGRIMVVRCVDDAKDAVARFEPGRVA